MTEQDRTTPILTIEELEHTYGRVTVLDDVSLDVDPGDVTAIIGPNGSGKTTLIRAIVGLHEPSGGTVRYCGPDATRPIGYLQQRPAFRPGQTVREALTFYAALVGETEADAVARLERVGLGAAADRNVEALSGGMTRLVGIAQATVGDPPLIVLDEPASGLDPGMSVRIFEVAEELTASGTAVLLSSHDLSLVERTADRVALLDDGSVARLGAPADVRAELGADSLLGAFESAITGDAGTVRVRGET
ncbi:ABC-type transport system ATP-binding protein (probable substrate copper) [Natronomonas moolapensis 8.8.11]|uniref:ABC-type transport system ATP-binding protein (Probable substrate copper) n=1 Tax=Natronomonas moolapensis (strain DSM 18674 / CECT 7526 / JCM 14361 / 8.8.11) TaxID=268739 RepID=M1XQU1_NATM8|nr:ABC transporter ATP-binding protein [Natronomonas moolapensis]CCQ36484.1 ABC-type transport system ATP-binding protein (probable substrate copper) [Natronomonas moolapensis 8.8.11]